MYIVRFKDGTGDHEGPGLPGRLIMSVCPQDLTPSLTREAFEQDDAIVKRGARTFAEVGMALARIRDSGGYRIARFRTFEAYALDRLGWARAHAYRCIAAAKVTATLSPRGDTPKTEKQARVLAMLSPEQMCDVWDRVRETHGAQPSAEALREVRDSLYSRSSSRRPIIIRAARPPEEDAGVPALAPPPPFQDLLDAVERTRHTLADLTDPEWEAAIPVLQSAIDTLRDCLASRPGQQRGITGVTSGGIRSRRHASQPTRRRKR